MTTRKFYILISIGLLVTNSDFILQHFITMTDLWIGVLKGIGIGVMILGLILMSRHKRIHQSN